MVRMSSNINSTDGGSSEPEFWCNVCSYDLQSSASLAEHCHGRKHRKKSGIAVEPTSKPPPLDESELFQDIASGRYQNVVVLTGAGVSTAAGVPDFRSRGGVFEKIRELFGDRLPEVYEHPELALTRSFANAYPDFVAEVRESILRPTIESMRDIKPVFAETVLVQNVLKF